MKKLNPKAPQTVAEYLKALPADRRKALKTLRALLRKNIPQEIKERLNWGMIAYEVPLKIYPDTYNGQPLLYAALASQKNHMALYLMCAYCDSRLEARFRKEYKSTGKKLDMGKSCIRFKKLDDLALEPIEKLLSSVSLDMFLAQQGIKKSKSKK